MTSANTSTPKATTTKLTMSKELYDGTKFAAQVVIPALGTLYFALASIWGLQDTAQVVGTLTALDTFLGILLGISTSGFNKTAAASLGDGNLVVDTTDPSKDTYSLELTTPLEELAGKDSITLKVTKPAN